MDAAMTDAHMKDAATAKAEDDYATMLAAEGDGLLGTVEWDFVGDEQGDRR
jgi:hypothetical protein